MIRRPPRTTRTDTLFPYTTLFRSCQRAVFGGAGVSLAWRREVSDRGHQRLPHDPGAELGVGWLGAGRVLHQTGVGRTGRDAVPQLQVELRDGVRLLRAFQADPLSARKNVV